MPSTLSHRQSIINQYINAKDNNKPFLIQKTFVENASLEMIVNTEAIAFPAKTIGVEEIAELLVRNFSEQYENIYTVCLSDSVKEQENIFSCQWLVGMTERRTGSIKVGCGLYDWAFENSETPKVESLSITLAYMEVFEQQCSHAIFQWLSILPHPWVERVVLLDNMPIIDELKVIRNYFNIREVAGDPQCKTD